MLKSGKRSRRVIGAAVRCFYHTPGVAYPPTGLLGLLFPSEQPPPALVVALGALARVRTERRGGRDGEFSHVQRTNRFQLKPVFTLAQLEQRHLHRGGPGKRKVPPARVTKSVSVVLANTVLGFRFRVLGFGNYNTYGSLRPFRLLIASRRALASSKLWPPDRKFAVVIAVGKHLRNT